MHLPFTAAVRGVSFHPEAVGGVNVGDTVMCAHDPTNPHDPCAVAVRSVDGDQLGHLPAAVAARAVDAFGVGCALRAEVVDVVGTGEGHTRGLRVRVVAEAAADSDGEIVRTPSGRVLGTFVAVDGDDVVVDTPGGVSRFPARLVRCGAGEREPAVQPA